MKAEVKGEPEIVLTLTKAEAEVLMMVVGNTSGGPGPQYNIMSNMHDLLEGAGVVEADEIDADITIYFLED